MHAPHLKRWTHCGPTETHRSRQELSPRWIWCAQFPSILNHSATVAYIIGHTFTSQNPMGPKANSLKLKRDSTGLQGSFCEVLRLLCLCAVYILQGSPSARCLVWRRGLLCQANHDQLGSPAHKEPRRRGLGPVCICRLLTSHLIALTHQLLLLRARVIYLYTDFPQD